MGNDDELRQVIRNNLKELRRTTGRTQSEVAKHCGKTENAVGAWEQGISLPDIVTLAKLAELYHVSIDYIYGRGDETLVIDSEKPSKDSEKFTWYANPVLTTKDGKLIEVKIIDKTEAKHEKSKRHGHNSKVSR